MCALPTDQSVVELVRWGSTLAVQALAGLVGVMIGAWLTSRREERQRQLAFLEKQLSLFYSPMLGVRNEIQTYGQLRVRVQNEAQAAWTQLCADTDDLPVHERRRITTERWPEFKRLIEFDNERLHKELLPVYRKMVALFRENYWLSEPATRDYYADMLEFVDLWERWIDKALPAEVLKRLEHTEENLKPFYEHLAKKHDEIRAKLKSGTGDA
ncbi:hypothetical protein [Limnohabitans sp.]|uniref:hypothetical protein n=1 Tax=Limnohabitans sp. TaxID=1907725 RepID=UPI0038BB5C2A